MITTRTTITLLIIAILISLGSTVIILTRLSTIPQGFTGMAKLDTGDVSIAIAGFIIISLDSNNSLIDFGTCTIPKNSTVSITSEMTQNYINSSGRINCTGSNLPSFLRIINMGGIRVNLTIQTNKIASDLLRSSNASMSFYSENSSTEGCLDKHIGYDDSSIDKWQPFLATNTEYIVCEHMDVGNPTPAINIWLNITIPTDANTNNVRDTAIMTFWASAFA